MEWMPIESAPRDDFVRILAIGWRGEYRTTQIIFWAFTTAFREVSVGDGLYRKEHVREYEGWRRENFPGEVPIDFEPTHWMPLPQPPLAEKEM